MQALEKQASAMADQPHRDLAARVAAGPQLAKSPRLHEMFLYLCERTFRGEVEDLHEQTIGEAVFGRQQGYDTSADNIVRVSAFQLRRKIGLYFAEEGRREPVVIRIPKGRYVVEFHPKELHGIPEMEPAVEPPAASKGSRWIGASVAIAALTLSVTLWPERSKVPHLSDHQRFWSRVFPPEREAYVVVADSGFALLQDVAGVSFGLNDYLKNLGPVTGPAGENPPELARRLVGRQYTSLSDASITFRLGAINHVLGGRAAVRSARSIDIRDLKMYNIVLLGSARSNPWVALLEDRLNFRIVYEQHPPRGFIHNRKPNAGEPAIFGAGSSRTTEGFGLVSYMSSLDGTGHIVTISGTNMESTEAAAELLLNERDFQRLLKRMGGSTDRYSYFETVIRARILAGAGSAPEIVAFRHLPTPY